MAAEQGQEEKKISSPLLIVILALLFLLLVLAGVATWLLLKKAPATYSQTRAHIEDRTPPSFMKLEVFTSNLLGENGAPGDSYLQVAMELRLEKNEPEFITSIQNYTPMIRDGVLRIISSKKPSELFTVLGKERLAEEVRMAINRMVGAPLGFPNPEEGPVRAVLFTMFIVQ